MSISCRAIGGQIKSLENEVIIVYLRAIRYLKAHSHEYLAYLILHLCKRMKLAERSVLSGESDVYCLLLEFSLLSGCLELQILFRS